MTKYVRRERGLKIAAQLESAKAGYKSAYDATLQPHVGHYFRNMYRIVKFVQQSAVPDKSEFVDLVRAQLSSNELLLLFYNALRYPKFKEFIQDYEMLENMPTTKLVDSSHVQFYKQSAFGKRKDVQA